MMGVTGGAVPGTMVSMHLQRTLRAALALAVLATLALGGFYAWGFWHARRLPDLVELQIFVVYDCGKHEIQKGDQRYVSATGALEACGVPAVSLKLFDGRGTLLHTATTDRRGEFHLVHNTVMDDPLADIRRLEIDSPRCRSASFPVRLEESHSFYGESTSARGYRYRGRFRFYCEPAGP
jgi:hypothetical protein